MFQGNILLVHVCERGKGPRVFERAAIIPGVTSLLQGGVQSEQVVSSKGGTISHVHVPSKASLKLQSGTEDFTLATKKKI